MVMTSNLGRVEGGGGRWGNDRMSMASERMYTLSG